MRERKSVETREPLDKEKQQNECVEDNHRGGRSLVGQRPVTAAGPACARPQLTASVNLLNYDEHAENAVSRSREIHNYIVS